MPIHDLGYRKWEGGLGPSWTRFSVISKAGIQVVLRNKWVRRVLLAAWLPTIFFAVMFFAYEQYLQTNELGASQQVAEDFFFSEMTEETPDFAIVKEGLLSPDPGKGRHTIWAWLLSTFLRLPQAIMTMLVVGMIAPPLISRDIRSRAFLLYFSRPINRYEYVFGKALVIASFLAFITMVPALGCYVFGISLSSDPTALLDTWDLPFRIVFASLVFMVPAVSVALMFSSMTSESRFAAFAWFATWGLGAVAWQVISLAMLAGETAKIERDFHTEQRAFNEAKEAQRQQDKDDGITPPLIDEDVAQEIKGEVEQIARGFEVDPTTGQVTFDTGQQTDGRGRAVDFVDGGWVFRHQEDRDREHRRQEALIAAQKKVRQHPLSLISMYDTLVRLQRYIFGLEKDVSGAIPSLVMMTLVTGSSWVILLRRVSAPLRA